VLNAKRDMEFQIENLAARLKTQQTQSAASKLVVDDTQLARCQKLVGDLRVRLEVADRFLASHGEPLELVPVAIDATEEIDEQIDRYFSAARPRNKLVDGRH
jgi:hypothetical protein